MSSASDPKSAKQASGKENTEANRDQPGQNERNFGERDKHGANYAQNRPINLRSVQGAAIRALHQAGTIRRGLKNPATPRTPGLGRAHGTGACLASEGVASKV